MTLVWYATKGPCVDAQGESVLQQLLELTLFAILYQFIWVSSMALDPSPVALIEKFKKNWASYTDTTQASRATRSVFIRTALSASIRVFVVRLERG